MHDWSHLNFERHTRKTDRIGCERHHTQGYELPSALLVSDRAGEPLAPIYQNLRCARGLHTTREPKAVPTTTHLDELAGRWEYLESLDLGRPLVHVVAREGDSVGHYRQWEKHRSKPMPNWMGRWTFAIAPGPSPASASVSNTSSRLPRAVAPRPPQAEVDPGRHGGRTPHAGPALALHLRQRRRQLFPAEDARRNTGPRHLGDLQELCAGCHRFSQPGVSSPHPSGCRPPPTLARAQAERVTRAIRVIRGYARL